jgi:hypothetical protein
MITIPTYIYKFTSTTPSFLAWANKTAGPDSISCRLLHLATQPINLDRFPADVEMFD